MKNISKRSLLKEKIEFKKEQNVRRAKNQQVHKTERFVIQMLMNKDDEKLRRVIEEKEMNKSLFKGDGIKEWYGVRRKQEILVEVKRMGQGNIFDLLSIVFRLKLDEKQITCEQIVCFYQSLLERTSRKHEIYMGMGNAYFNVGWYKMAELSFLKALNFRQTEKVYENLLMVSTSQYNKEKSMIYISKCLSINENNSCAYFWKLALSPKDRSSLKRFSEENPSYYFIYFYRRLAETNHKLKEKLLRKVAKYNPTLPQYNIQIANELQQPWNSMKLKNFTEIYPDNDEYFYKLGEKEFSDNNYKASAYYFEQAFLRNPYDNSTTQKLGKSYHHLKQYQQAIKYYKKALELNPLLQSSRINLINLYQKDKAKQQQKMSLVREGLKISPKYIFFLRIMADYNIAHGLFQAALQFLARLRGLSASAEVDDMISKCFLSLGNIQGIYWAFSSISKGSFNTEQILHRTIKFLKHEKRYLAMLRWLIQLIPMVLDQDDESSTIPLETLLEFIQTSCFPCLQKQSILEVIEQKTNQLQQNIDNRLTFLVLGKILVELKYFEESAVLFNIVKELSQKNEPIYIQIIRFFGDCQNGIFSSEERDKRKQFRDRFTTSFELEYKKVNNGETQRLDRFK